MHMRVWSLEVPFEELFHISESLNVWMLILESPEGRLNRIAYRHKREQSRAIEDISDARFQPSMAKTNNCDFLGRDIRFSLFSKPVSLAQSLPSFLRLRFRHYQLFSEMINDERFSATKIALGDMHIGVEPERDSGMVSVLCCTVDLEVVSPDKERLDTVSVT